TCHFLAAEITRQRVGREARVVEDLVRPGAADSGDHLLVAQERVEPARLAGDDRPELLGADAERFWSEVGELPLGFLGSQEPNAGALLRSGLGQDELRTALEGEPESG